MLPVLSKIFDGCRVNVRGPEVSSQFGFWDFNNRAGDASEFVGRARVMGAAGRALLDRLRVDQEPMGHEAGVGFPAETHAAIEALRTALQNTDKPGDFALLYPWSSIDARIQALAAVGITDNVWLTLMNVPPHGTIDLSGLYNGDATRHTVDARENALPITDATPWGLAVGEPWFKNPSRIRPKFCYEFARRAAERYVAWPLGRKQKPVIAGILPWNEYDDGISFPPMDDRSLGNYELARQRYREDILLPMRQGVTDATAPYARAYCPVGAPETAYDGELSIHLAWDYARATNSPNSPKVADVDTFHCWAQDGGKDTGTLANWKEWLDKKVSLFKKYPYNNVMVTEMGDRGAGWILDALAYGTEKYPQISNWVAYPSIDDGEQIVDPVSYELTSYGEKWKKFAQQSRRRAVTR